MLINAAPYQYQRNVYRGSKCSNDKHDEKKKFKELEAPSKLALKNLKLRTKIPKLNTKILRLRRKIPKFTNLEICFQIFHPGYSNLLQSNVGPIFKGVGLDFNPDFFLAFDMHGFGRMTFGTSGHKTRSVSVRHPAHGIHDCSTNLQFLATFLKHKVLKRTKKRVRL